MCVCVLVVSCLDKIFQQNPGPGRLAITLQWNCIIISSSAHFQLAKLTLAFTYRVATSPTTMEPAESPSTAASLRMRTSAWGTLELASCPWPTLGPTPMARSSSSALRKQHGERRAHGSRGSLSLSMLVCVNLMPTNGVFCLQAGWEARGVWERGRRHRAGQEHGAAGQPERQDKVQGCDRRLRPTLSTEAPPPNPLVISL